MAPGPSPLDAAAVEEALLKLPEVELKGVFRRSSNYTFLAVLSDESRPGEELAAVYKPAQGESPLWDFPTGTLYRRELATYQLARFLGWPSVPPTVIREDAPHGVGALQLYIDADPAVHYLSSDGRPRETWEALAVFDVVINNADRKSGHCLKDAEGTFWVIDHGLTFHVEPKLRTVIWDFAGRPVPRRIQPDLERAADSLRSGQLGACLGELLSRREMLALRRRLDAVTSPGYKLPQPTSAWSVPWPPV